MLWPTLQRRVEVSSIGSNTFLFKQMKATESLSEPFAFEIDLLSLDDRVSLGEVLGETMTVRLELPTGGDRFFHGYVTRMAYVGQFAEYSMYRAVLRPWLWFLTRNSDCRIFQEKTVPEIVLEVFRERGFTNFEIRLSEEARAREYCVQYRETDFAFVSRLLEEEGIYYYFRHEEDHHTLVLADSKSAHEAIPEYEYVQFKLSRNSQDDEGILDWVVSQRIQTGSHCLDDFDFEKPRTELLCRRISPNESLDPNFETFDYPGGYRGSDEGGTCARTRLEASEAKFELATGTSDAQGLAVGCLFNLFGCPRDDQDREYLLLSTSIELSSEEYRSGGNGDNEVEFRCKLTAADANTAYRPDRSTPISRVEGPQTAIVVGPEDNEIWTDTHGRVKVQFHWDRYGMSDENSSCWIRVAQIWAGKSWGGIHIPRVGQEVVVEFLEGNPDRPLITGSVYNGRNLTPYKLPENKTVSGIMTQSSTGGGGFNELRFQDAKDREQILLRSERDFDLTVCNQSKERVYGDKHAIVGWEKDGEKGGDLNEIVYQDHNRCVKRHQVEQIEGSLQTLVGKGDAEEGGYLDLVVEKDRKSLIEGNDDLRVVGTRRTLVEGDQSLQVSGDLIEEVDRNLCLTAAGEMYIRSQGSLVLEATNDITIKAGGSHIRINSSGITVNGAMIWINSSAGESAAEGNYIESKLVENAEEAAPTEPSVADGGTTNREV